MGNSGDSALEAEVITENPGMEIAEVLCAALRWSADTNTLIVR